MRYVYVENGQVKLGARNLPINWKNISNLPSLNNQSLLEYGWYPHTFIEAPNQSKNTIITGSYYEMTESEVIEYQTIRNKTQEELQSDINNKWTEIRRERNDLLNLSDWTQLSDVSLTELEKNSWKVYRQALRDITLQSDPFEIVWPTKPN